jgi:hypothetical protein
MGKRVKNSNFYAAKSPILLITIVFLLQQFETSRVHLRCIIALKNWGLCTGRA